MAEAWPSTLQNKVDRDSFSYEFGETTIRSQMDIGPDKVRRRTTRPIDKLTTSIQLDYSEYSTFQVFFNTTLNGGVNKFTYENPLTGVLEEFRFTKPPSIRPLGGRVFTVSMEWEKV